MSEQPENSGSGPLVICASVTLICLLVTGLYAYTRYVYFGPIAESKIPLYISNKAISWSSVVILSGSYMLGPLAILTGRFKGWLSYRKPLGMIGLWLATLHILASLPIFNMFYYTGFFNVDGTLKVTTELSMLAGAVAWMVLLLPAAASVPSIAESISKLHWRIIQRLGLIALLITFCHVAWLGWHGWFLPAEWFGGMPPITLLSCGAILLLLLLRLAVLFYGSEKN